MVLAERHAVLRGIVPCLGERHQVGGVDQRDVLVEEAQTAGGASVVVRALDRSGESRAPRPVRGAGHLAAIDLVFVAAPGFTDAAHVLFLAADGEDLLPPGAEVAIDDGLPQRFAGNFLGDEAEEFLVEGRVRNVGHEHSRAAGIAHGGKRRFPAGLRVEMPEPFAPHVEERVPRRALVGGTADDREVATEQFQEFGAVDDLVLEKFPVVGQGEHREQHDGLVRSRPALVLIGVKGLEAAAVVVEGFSVGGVRTHRGRPPAYNGWNPLSRR